MSDVAVRMIEQLETQLTEANAALDLDPGASAVARAVVAEFGRKLTKNRPAIVGSDPVAAREAVVELEQAADSAKWAATADDGAAERTRDLVVSAHDTICTYKATGKLLAPASGQ